MPQRAAGHRVTWWHDEVGNAWQVAVACLDELLEPVVEVTEPVGPFEAPQEAYERAVTVCHGLGGWRAHQQSLSI